MKTVWCFGIKVGDEYKSSCSADTLEKAIAGGFRDAIYYKAIYPNETVSVVDMREMCAKCSNTTLMTVYGRYGYKEIKCKECKGKPPHTTIGDIVLEMPDAANKINLCQAG